MSTRPARRLVVPGTTPLPSIRPPGRRRSGPRKGRPENLGGDRRAVDRYDVVESAGGARARDETTCTSLRRPLLSRAQRAVQLTRHIGGPRCGAARAAGKRAGDLARASSALDVYRHGEDVECPSGTFRRSSSTAFMVSPQGNGHRSGGLLGDRAGPRTVRCGCRTSRFKTASRR